MFILLYFCSLPHPDSFPQPAYQDEAMEEIYYQVEAKEGIYQVIFLNL